MDTVLTIDGNSFPGIWRYLLPEDFAYMKLPQERHSTCHNCPSVACQSFRPDYRCCTYLPKMTNFQLSQVFHDNPESIKRLVHRRLVTPEGLTASPTDWFLSAVQNTSGQFGKGDLILCPMFNKELNNCGVHRFRNATCSTFFCYKDHGAEGEIFWDKLETLVVQIESALSQWIMSELGINIEMFFQSLADAAEDWTPPEPPISGPVGWTETIMKGLWQDWYHRETEYFQKSYQLLQDHKHELYEIAKSYPMKRPSEFERKMQSKVPDAISHRLSESETYQKGDIVSIESLWYEFSAVQRNLLKIPSSGEEMVQNPYLSLVELNNFSLDQTLKPHLEGYSHAVINPDSPTQNLDSMVVIKSHETELWHYFSSPKPIDETLYLELTDQDPQEIMRTISEWIKRQILVDRKRI
ncbi:MAG: hypothetical protein HRU19_26285 [Pseudobacteriovorax sp.]|nr:hypothetical protein [Pseudobacteriovorax sp.]